MNLKLRSLAWLLLVTHVCEVYTKRSPSHRLPSRRSASSRPGRVRHVDSYDENDESDFVEASGEIENDDHDEFDGYEEERHTPRPKRASSRSTRHPMRKGSSDRHDARGSYYSRKRRSGREIGHYSSPPSAFSRGVTAFRNSFPDASTMKMAVGSSISSMKEATASVSSTVFREIKGFTSSELEQVMLKATKPDDTPVKGKHVERLVGVTYQIEPKFDIYGAVLRKLWGKMAEKDWRTTLKALYLLHRFAADGAPAHAAALKARLRELRRTRDPKRKEKFFNTKQLLFGEKKPENAKFREFMARYAHYVLLRAQCFGGLFDEISLRPKGDKKRGSKPITATSLRVEHLDAAELILKAGLLCDLKDGEDCENTAIAAERVAADMMGLSSAVASALNSCLRAENINEADGVLLVRWCLFYKDSLFPSTKSMVKSLSPKLDAYGLYLPSRMGAILSTELLEKGLTMSQQAAATEIESNDGHGRHGLAVKENPTLKREISLDTGDDLKDDTSHDGRFSVEYEYEDYYDEEEE